MSLVPRSRTKVWPTAARIWTHAAKTTFRNLSELLTTANHLLTGIPRGNVNAMSDVCVSIDDLTNDPACEADQPARLKGPDVEKGPAAAAEEFARSIVRVEANFLRLPLFSLDNKHMRTMDGIRCEGTFNRAGKSFAFTYAVTRNAATYYPGPLARSAHYAFLSLATERGFPIQNPIIFSWRELCAIMGVQPSGQIVAALREAITATKGLMIESHAALFSKAEGAPITNEDRRRVLGLYDEVEFYGVTRSDGTKADTNAVWLSHWYLENLNALYSAPIDYLLWRSLNERSPISSRLYEFLFFKFYGGHDLLRFNYPTLVKFIPARTERYFSHAKKQLQPAFDLLCATGVLRKVDWVESRGGLPQILLHRGQLLNSADRTAPADDFKEEDFVLDRIEDVRLPEWQVVESFHAAWGHADFRPSRAELDLARDLIARYGLSEVQALVPRLVKRLKIRWTGAKTFNAVVRYLPEVQRELESERSRAKREQMEEQQRQVSHEAAIRQAQDRAVVKALWDGLPSSEQEEIRTAALKHQPHSIVKFPRLAEAACLAELARRRGFPTGSQSNDAAIALMS